MTESLSNVARRKTEELILQGTLAVGTKITERDLAERLGMSRAPVREAIRELIGVGLLEQISARGKLSSGENFAGTVGDP